MNGERWQMAKQLKESERNYSRKVQILPPSYKSYDWMQTGGTIHHSTKGHIV